MENASKLLMLGFMVIIFAAAVTVTLAMYYENESIINEIERVNSNKVIMVGD